MYKIYSYDKFYIYLDFKTDSLIINYDYDISNQKILQTCETNNFNEYALSAEEFAKKWLEHNKEWL